MPHHSWPAFSAAVLRSCIAVRILPLSLFAIGWLHPTTAHAFDCDSEGKWVHETILRAALDDENTLDNQALQWVIRANLLSDGVEGPCSLISKLSGALSVARAQTDPWRHFDNVLGPREVCTLWERGVKRMFDAAVAFSAPEGEEKRRIKNRQLALEEFGRLTHAIQDFYSHTNWVELQLKNGGVVNLATQLIAETCDPDSFPQDLTGGFFNPQQSRVGGLTACLSSGPTAPFRFCHTCPAGAAGCREIAKDSDEGHGKQKATPEANSPTLYEVAKSAAIRATRQAWDELHRRIVAKYEKDSSTDAECLFMKLAWGQDRTCHRYWRFSGTVDTERKDLRYPLGAEAMDVKGFEVHLRWQPTRYPGPKAPAVFAKVEGNWSVNGTVTARSAGGGQCEFKETAPLNVVPPPFVTVVGRMKIRPEPDQLEFTGVADLPNALHLFDKVPCRVGGQVLTRNGHPLAETGLNLLSLMCLDGSSFFRGRAPEDHEYIKVTLAADAQQKTGCTSSVNARGWSWSVVMDLDGQLETHK